jgi:hypothetical protein
MQEELEKLGDPRDRWETEMLAIVRRELDRAADYTARGKLAPLASLSTALLTQAENCKGYAGGLLYAVRRRRDMLEDGALSNSDRNELIEERPQTVS